MLILLLLVIVGLEPVLLRRLRGDLFFGAHDAGSCCQFPNELEVSIRIRTRRLQIGGWTLVVYGDIRSLDAKVDFVLIPRH